MQWHMVEISGINVRDFQTKYGAQIDAFLKKFQEAKISNGVDIYRRDLTDRKCVFFFPPQASELLLAEPAPKGTAPCEQPVDLPSMRRINFR